MTAARPAVRLVAGIGVVLAVGMLPACSSGGSRPSAAGTPVAGSSTEAAAGSAQSTTAGVADSPSAAPAPLPDDQPVATDSPRPRTTDVVLSFVGWNATTSAVEAGGYMSPVVESGGTCTLELTKGAKTVTVSAPAEADASTTTCGNLTAARSTLAAGSWKAVLSYASTTTTGRSDPATVQVPQ